MTADWIQDSGYTPDMPNALQRFLARVRFWLRQHGFYNANISDRDLVYMLSEITRAGYEKRWNEKEWAQRDVRYSVIGEDNTDLNGLEQTDTDGDNKKSSTSVRSESGLSHLYSDYRRLVSTAKNAADDAIQSVEQDYKIAPEEEKVKRAIDGIKNVLLHIQSKKNFLQAQNIVATMEVDAGFTRESEDSVYLEISDKSTVRVSDHAATASTFTTIGEDAHNISIVILYKQSKPIKKKKNQRRRRKLFIPSDDVNLLELQFSRDFLDRGKTPILLADIAHFLATGEYVDNAGALKVETSGTEEFKQRVLQNITPTVNKYAAVLAENERLFRSDKSDEKGRKVRHSVAPQIDSEQFKKFFENSVVVDENGKPMVVYHGSSADFTVFDHKFAMRNGAAEGRGFYFTSNREKAEGFKTENGKLFEVYLSMQKPLNPDELTITRAEVEKIIRSIDTDGTYVADYAEDDIGYPGKAWHDKAVKRAAQMIYESSDTNADIVAEIYMVFGQGDALAKITEATGYDGFIKEDVYVVFSSNQVKSATDNIGTFDKNNPDIRYSVRDDLDPETRAMIELFIPIIQEVDMDNVENDTLAEKFNERYAAKLGYSIDGGTAHMYAFWAEDILRRERKERADKAKRERAYFWYGEMNPFFGFFTEHVGSGVINPGKRFWGQDATGSFISEKFKRNTVLRRTKLLNTC